MKLTKNTFPQEVEHVANETVKSTIETGFFDDEEIHPDVKDEAQIIMFNECGKVLMERWMNGNEIVYNSEEEVGKILQFTIVTSGLYHMVDLGVLDSIEDENGEDVFWIKDEYKELSPAEIQERLVSKAL